MAFTKRPGFAREETEYPDAGIQRVLDRIQGTYGDTVSVAKKNKALSKFGRNTALGATDTTLMGLQGSELNETFVSTNLIDSISSSDQTNDVGITFTIEGHTIDGSGNLTFVVQNATLDGTDARTEVTLTTPLARATRIYVAPSGTFNSPQAVPTGTIYVYDNTGGQTSGVPNNANQTKLLLGAGLTQSEKAATSISSVDYWILFEWEIAVDQGSPTASTVTCRMETRDVFNGGVWRPLGAPITVEIGQTPFSENTFRVYKVVPKNHDWRIVGRTDTGTASVFAEARGLLATIV